MRKILLLIICLIFMCSCSHNISVSSSEEYIENDDGTYERVERPTYDYPDPYENGRNW